MINDQKQLLSVLHRLIQCINGPWFIGDGALLGLIREGGLLPHDHDIDIYLLPESTISRNALKTKGLDIEHYYLNAKIYDKDYFYKKLNPWTEFLSTKKLMYPELNRAQLTANFSQEYKTKKIQNIHTQNHIDVFYLTVKDDYYRSIYRVPYWGHLLFFLPEEVENLQPAELHGLPVFIPNNAKEILRRQYGSDWRVPKPEWKYY